IMGIFHAQLVHVGNSDSIHEMQFLWVHWFGVINEHPSGLQAGKLPKVGFFPAHDPCIFGFLDPLEVIRGCHLIPCFAEGRTTELIRAGSLAGRSHGEESDWSTYYVNIFADRDMFMRFICSGVGQHGHAG
ncbi:hypothetical protein SERLA73DRAFT_45164, partial [Serpula lacrymans var. lacrymans S7.3]